jgi:hypothetical protein
VANPGQADWDNDGVPGTQPPSYSTWGGDACDDSDSDSKSAGPGAGYLRDSVELFIGTDQYDNCPETSASNDEPVDAWPPDFNDNTRVTTGDLVLLAQHYANAATYAARYDLNASGPPKITSGDLVIFTKYYPGTGRDRCP